MTIPASEPGVPEALAQAMFATLVDLAPAFGMTGRFKEHDKLSSDDRILMNAVFSSFIQRGLIVPGPNLVIAGILSSERERIAAQAGAELVRAVLEAVCHRYGISLESSVAPGESARNYELADRLGISEVFGLKKVSDDTAGT